MPTTDSLAPATQTDVSVADAPPRFEQTMQGLLDLLKALPRDGAVTVSMLTDWLLPLFEDARDEYHALAESAVDQVTDVIDELDESTAAIDTGTRQVVFAAVGLAIMAYKRAGWIDDKSGQMELTARCPKDLSDEYAKVQSLVQLWASGTDITALQTAQR